MKGSLAVVALDLKRLWQDRVRLISSLVQPLLYLFVLGSGLGANSTLGGPDYLRFIYPGVIGLTLLFTSVFSAILIVFDRQFGFLKAVLVAPLSRVGIAAAKVASGALQALVPALLLLLFAPLIGVHAGALGWLELIAAMTGAAVTFSALGVAVAARFNSTVVFPVIANAVLLPMFFVSGAMFPLTGTPRWLQRLAYFDPVAYAVDLMRGALLGQRYFPVWLSVIVLTAFVLGLGWAAARVFAAGEDA
ncbi:MAG: ABC transporter permease [Gammaproteobacteria bacterium]|nr:ABC transporter permease [Gammaproteobacteria bacterium]